MDVAELRQQILREIERARKQAAERRETSDAAHGDYARFIVDIAGPLVRQASQILRAENLPFQAETPAGSAKLASDKSADDFIEFVLDTSVRPPRVLGRSSVALTRNSVSVEETPIAPGSKIGDLTDADLLPFLMAAIGRLLAR